MSLFLGLLVLGILLFHLLCCGPKASSVEGSPTVGLQGGGCGRLFGSIETGFSQALPPHRLHNSEASSSGSAGNMLEARKQGWFGIAQMRAHWVEA